MPLPWISIVEAALGLTDVAMARLSRRRGGATDNPQALAGSTPGAPATLETHLAGVVVSALKEVFERDNRRLDLEREQAEAARERADRALRLEVARQAGDREIGRLRLAAGIAAASWLVTLLLAIRLMGGGMAPRLVLGAGAVCFVAALGCVFAGLSQVNRNLARPDAGPTTGDSIPAVAFAAWLIVAGLGLVSVTVLLP